MSAPIIFCHYGNKAYLRYVLECARLTNPDKEIVLLGDASNRRVARKLGVRHEAFEAHGTSERFATFERVYTQVQGPQHSHLRGGRDWLRFVFERWFYVGQFVRGEGVSSFWHFDSDNMLLVPLAPEEARFNAYDCTEQCNGMCMNGFVSGPEVVEAYLDKINEIFGRDKWLTDERVRLTQEAPDCAFTEMGAYAILKEEEGLNTARLNAVHAGTSFDDCICQPHGMTLERISPEKQIKKVLLNPDGRFFCQKEDTGELIQMNSLNLSWVPAELFPTVLDHCAKSAREGMTVEPETASPDTLAMQFAADKGGRPLERILRRLKRAFVSRG